MAGEAFLAGPNAGGNLCDIPTGLKKIYIYTGQQKKKRTGASWEMSVRRETNNRQELFNLDVIEKVRRGIKRKLEVEVCCFASGPEKGAEDNGN